MLYIALKKASYQRENYQNRKTKKQLVVHRQLTYQKVVSNLLDSLQTKIRDTSSHKLDCSLCLKCFS